MNAPEVTTDFKWSSDEFWRVNKQIEWYEQTADRMMRLNTRLKVVEITLGAAIPIVALVSPDPHLANIINGSLGSIIAAVATYMQFRQIEGNWQRLRSAAEALKRERWLYVQKAGPYADPNAGKSSANLFAQNVERIISAEHSDWVSLMKSAQSRKSTDSTRSSGSNTEPRR